MFSVGFVRQSVSLSTGIVTHHTGPPSWTCDLIVQEALLVTSDVQDWRPVQSCSPENHEWLARERYTSYWNAFLFNLFFTMY